MSDPTISRHVEEDEFGVSKTGRREDLARLALPLAYELLSARQRVLKKGAVGIAVSQKKM